MPVAFIPQTLLTNPALAYSPIIAMYACAHHSGPASDIPGSVLKTNHWVLRLVLSDEVSVILDPSPGIDGVMTLIVSLRGRNPSLELTRCAEENVEFVKAIRLNLNLNLDLSTTATGHMPGTTAVTISAMLDTLMRNNYHRYQFINGKGCRFWVRSVIELLRTEQYLVGVKEEEAEEKEGNEETTAAALEIVWDASGKRVSEEEQTGMDIGIFGGTR